MKWLKRGGVGCGGLLVLAVLFVLAGYLLPSELELQTERVVDVRPEDAFSLVASSEGVKEWWAPISKKAVADGYPEMQVTPDGMRNVTFSAGGSTMETWELVSIDPGEREVVWRVDFAGVLTVDRTLRVDPEGAQASRITWKETAEISNPLMRWMAMVSDPTPNFQDAMAGMEL